MSNDIGRAFADQRATCFINGETFFPSESGTIADCHRKLGPEGNRLLSRHLRGRREIRTYKVWQFPYQFAAIGWSVRVGLASPE
jgi:hypothetical protein